MRSASPFRSRHVEACRFGRSSVRLTAHNKEVQIYGLRGDVKYPLMSIMIQQELGNCRHALAQRVVAGTMTVHYAPGDGPPKLKPSPEGSAESSANPSPPSLPARADGSGSGASPQA